MPAEVETMFSGNRIIPWHGLGNIVDGVLTAREAIQAAGLDWAVVKEPATYPAPIKLGMPFEVTEDPDVPGQMIVVAAKQIVIPDTFVTRRLSDDRILGKNLGPDYSVFQNVEAFDLFDAVMGDEGKSLAKYETAGALFDGKVVFILARLEKDIVVAGDKQVPYLLLLTSHDGSTALRMLTTPVRVVCANTVRMALGNYESAWSIRHTTNMKSRVGEAREALELSISYYEAFEREVEKLMNIGVNEKRVESILASVFPKKGTDVLNEKALAVRGLYESSDTIGEFKGTGWGLLNAVNEWELWTSPTRDESKRLERQAREIVSGTSTPLTRKAHALLVGDAV